MVTVEAAVDEECTAPWYAPLTVLEVQPLL
jgi:hypothetical protein